MKKTTLLLSFVACAAFAQAQTNLLVNPGFETWEAGLPTSWTIAGTTKGIVSENATTIAEGTKSLKSTECTATYAIYQTVSVTPGKTYTLSMSYYIEAGDATDARIWCNFKNGTLFMAEADLIATGLYTKLRGPGCENLSGSLFFPDVKGSWQTYTIEFVAPANVTDFNFEFRTYKAPAIVYWDKMFFGEKTGTGFSNATANSTKFTLKDRTLESKVIANGTVVEVFTALGTKVQTAVLVNGSVQLNDLTKGLYIVRAGKYTQKIML